MATAASFLAPPPRPVLGAAPPSSASGLLALLSEPSAELKAAALSRLLAVVDGHWHEVAEALPDLEAIAEGISVAGAGGDGPAAAAIDLGPEARRTAASVASRVYFHLEEPVQALRLALDAGVEGMLRAEAAAGPPGDPYVECLVSAAIDAYVAQSKGGTDADADADADALALDPAKLGRLVDAMFERCHAEGRHGQALGVALEARSLERVTEVLARAGTAPTGPEERLEALSYALESAASLVPDRSFRAEVLDRVAGHLDGLFRETASSSSQALRARSAVALSVAHQRRGRSGEAAALLAGLLGGGPEEDRLLGLQLCFDLVDTGDQAYAGAVARALPEGAARTATAADEKETEGAVNQKAYGAHDAARRVLTGGFVTELSLSFLHKRSDSDPLIMDTLRATLDERGNSRNSVLHGCAVATHAYLNSGTTNDAFLRDHLDWMKKASNWAKFSATASLGAIHAGHTTEAMTLLEPYLPPSSSGDDADGAAPPPAVQASGGYAEGGSLYALGLIHGSRAGSSEAKRSEATAYLRGHLRASHANEAISHGAALGVGLAGFGSADLDVVNELKELLYTDSAVAGEAAGMAVGMVLAGTGAGNARSGFPASTDPGRAEEIAEVVLELRNYARETQHEKIIRGISMGMALINFGQEENADAVIEEMRSDRDPILRYGAMYSLALAYCGTGSNKAIRILLHTAVSDVSDDVRMAAVIGLAFVLFKTPERVPQLVKLLLESFNPHVRYASCMAVGIAMAGTGDADSVALLAPMLEDMADFVRQGALLGTAMIYMQQSDTCNGRKIKSFREKLASFISDKHQSTLTKMGATLATGIIDAGGRNCSLDLGSRNGFTKMSSAVGLALWLQHWHWYPFMHMFSMALTPTFTIGLNGDFKFPKNFEIQCNSKPSVFSYPKRLEEKKEKEKKRVETVTLSTTAKNKARLARKKAKETGDEAGAEAMDVDEKKGDTGERNEKEEEGEKMDVDAAEVDEEEKKPAKKKKEPEPTSFRISNPSRITKAQADACSFDLNQRYRPILPDEKACGVIMLTDSTPGEDEELGAVKAPSEEVDGEANAPEPFEWAPPGHPEYNELPLPTEPSVKTEESSMKKEDGGADAKDTDDAAPAPPSE